MSINLTAIMKKMLEIDSPDLHLRVGHAPVLRLKNGELNTIQAEVMTKGDIYQVIDEITTPEQISAFREKHQIDFSYHIAGLSRFRVNVFDEYNGPGIAFRIIPEHIPTLEEIGLTQDIKDLLMESTGLVLVTGSTGMGKSTTLASMIDYINENKKSHIITVEDPIEFVYKNKKCLITQRELNAHTRSFSEAISGALRQDPDVVMVGEMRDLETIAAAITLAETGHLVLSTLHTTDAAQTVDRIIDVFPPYQQQQIRSQLSSVLKGVISQVLIPRADGDGRVAAREVMFVNDAIRNCIAKEETHQIYSVIQISRDSGMNLMDDSLEDLCRDGVITEEAAVSHATDPDFFRGKLKAEI